MDFISAKRLILLTLATSSLLTSNIFCADELMMSNLYSKDNYDKYSKPRGDPKGEKERSLNFEEWKDWSPKNVTKITPAVNKMPHSAANLPLRFGRTMEDERGPGAMANLPLRFGRNTEESISRRIPNLPQRFGRTTAKSVAKTLSDLLQQSMHSPPANELLYSMTCQPQEIQNSHQKHPRRLGFKKRDDTELKQEK
ncbi:pro-FMRFamide-related neuropeptide VF isoform X1 [Equus asinus]|uniref:pro-FMRFamide-related neuropeptide VF isoform X1 n=1 Tax=Equus asinus TaxID=9793 RepID=UPI00071A8D16|nr:pro-FMRFamide-related neuropeptide VF [Equus asinus]